MNPIPAAAAVDPVTVLPRNVIAAHAARPSQAKIAMRDPAGDGRRLEQDRRVDPADDDGQDRGQAEDGRDGDDLGAEEGAARCRSSRGRTPPCRGPSRSTTAPIARMIAANAPNWARFFQSWSTASAAVGDRDDEDAELVAADGLEDLGQELREQRRAQADEQEQHADDDEPVRPPRLEQLLAEEDPEAGHHAARPTSRRKTSSSDGRTRSYAASRTPSRDDDRQEPGRGDGRRRVTETISPLSVSVTRSIQGDRPKARHQRRDGLRLPGLRVEPVERQGVAGEQVVERPLGDEAAVIEDADPVADALDVGEHVGGEDDRGALAQLGDQREQVAPALRVERADRLVEDEQVGLGHERLGDAESLAHPARVAADPAVRRIGQADALQRPAGAIARVGGATRPCSRPARVTSSRPVIQP